MVCPDIENCADYMSDEFPIDAELTLSMYQLALEILGVSLRYPEDDKNDGKAVESLQSTDPNENNRKS
jgi:hypothetical protein